MVEFSVSFWLFFQRVSQSEKAQSTNENFRPKPKWSQKKKKKRFFVIIKSCKKRKKKKEIEKREKSIKKNTLEKKYKRLKKRTCSTKASERKRSLNGIAEAPFIQTPKRERVWERALDRWGE